MSATLSVFDVGSIPARAGIGLRTPHHREVLDTHPAVAWFEVHSENFFADGGPAHDILTAVRCDYPLSLHGVGLSLGSNDPLNRWHLDKLKTLMERYQPGLVSEHLSWSSVGGRYLNDLLPLPYTEEALRHISTRIQQVQDYLGRQILIENLSSYLQFTNSSIPEWEFIAAVAQHSGCGILLDVNNIYVNSRNHGFDASAYLQAIPVPTVKEMHLAGHTDEGDCLIDTHSRPVAPAVWTLYEQAVRRFGRLPTLIEWDTDVPPLTVLMSEAARAEAILENCDARAA
ncbi:MAG: MNIO family bufferin maturase [Gammaproteobacteria bacterium]